MHEVFSKKSGKVVVIEGAGATRMQLTEVLKSLGFTDIAGVPSIKEALGLIESEPIRWLLTSLNADKDENGMQLIKLITEQAALGGLLVSLLLEDQDSFVTPLAFQYGMLSCHRKPFTTESLTGEIKTLIARAEQSEWNSTLVAASYLREFLIKEERVNELLVFERELVKTYPSHHELLYNLLHPLMKLGHKAEASSILCMLKAIDKTQNARIDELVAQFFPEGLTAGKRADGTGEVFNFLGIDRVMVVDSDETVHITLKEIFGTCGITEVDCFTSGQEALEYLSRRPDPGLVIQEWRIPKVPGPLFIQRAKARYAASATFVVLSSLLHKEDAPFMREMGVAALIEKPVDREQFLQKIAYILQQERMPTELAFMEKKIRSYLQQDKLTDARNIMERLLQDDKVPGGAKELMEAEFLYACKDYKKAKEHAIAAIKQAGDSVFTLNLLGKILVNLREFHLSLKCFQKAQTIAPQNLERICAMAEIHSELGHESAAQEAIDRARDIDPSSTRVGEAEARIAIDVGDVARAKKLMGNLEAIERVVAAMNNSAVAMAGCGMLDEGIDKYKITLESIPEKRKDIRAIVLYNLSLGYVRNGMYAEARDSLDICLKLKGTKIIDKAASLYKKVKKSMETGGGIDLHQDAPFGVAMGNGQADAGDENSSWGEKPGDQVTKEISAVLRIGRGEIGCYLLYNAVKIEAKAFKLIEKMPRFTVRSAILREESRGADQLLKQRLA